jgi:hypothetical protein
MALFDRTPPSQRHIGKSTNMHREDFRLQMLQSRLEKNLSSCGESCARIRKSLRIKLRAVHSQWTNWHLRNGDFENARKSISQAVKYDLAPGVALKWILAQTAPALARKVVSLRDRGGSHCETSSSY